MHTFFYIFTQATKIYTTIGRLIVPFCDSIAAKMFQTAMIFLSAHRGASERRVLHSIDRICFAKIINSDFHLILFVFEGDGLADGLCSAGGDNILYCGNLCRYTTLPHSHTVLRYCPHTVLFALLQT